MRQTLLIVLLFNFALFGALREGTLSAQTRIKDVYAVAPDSIFPLLTKNNRLDQIDFLENAMKASVKNRFDEYSELLELSDSYLHLRLSESCLVEMRLLSDSTFCMVQTYKGPAPNSRVRFFGTDWTELSQGLESPAVDEFLSEDVDTEVRLALQALPLIQATLSKESNQITWKLQTSELTRKQREKVEGKVREITRLLPQP